MAQDVEAEVVKVSKSSARDKIFSSENTVPKVKQVTFNGVALEIRQPTVNEFMNSDNSDQKAWLVKSLIDHAYLAGTEERVFDQADYDQLMAMPFNGSWSEVIGAIQDLMDIKVGDKVKN